MALKNTAPATVKAVAPAVFDAFMAMRKAIVESGPVDQKWLELMLVCSFTVARQESGFKVHLKRAFELGATVEEARHAVLINIGATVSIEPCGEALTWIDEVAATTEKP